MKQCVAKTADVIALEFYVERIGHEFADIHIDLGDDPAGLAGLIAGRFAVFGALDHGHLAIGLNGFWAFARVGRAADIGKGNGHAIGELAHIREDSAEATTGLMGNASTIRKGGLCHNGEN